jgi:hypothetical protein
MSKFVSIKRPFAVFNDSAAPSQLAVEIDYEGDLAGLLPEEIHLDTQNAKITVLLNNGQEEEICGMTPEHIAVIQEISEQMREMGKPLKAGFYQVNEKNEHTKACYKVDALVI